MVVVPRALQKEEGVRAIVARVGISSFKTISKTRGEVPTAAPAPPIRHRSLAVGCYRRFGTMGVGVEGGQVGVVGCWPGKERQAVAHQAGDAPP